MTTRRTQLGRTATSSVNVNPRLHASRFESEITTICGRRGLSARRRGVSRAVCRGAVYGTGAGGGGARGHHPARAFRAIGRSPAPAPRVEPRAPTAAVPIAAVPTAAVPTAAMEPAAVEPPPCQPAASTVGAAAIVAGCAGAGSAAAIGAAPIATTAAPAANIGVMYFNPIRMMELPRWTICLPLQVCAPSNQ